MPNGAEGIPEIGGSGALDLLVVAGPVGGGVEDGVAVRPGIVLP